MRIYTVSTTFIDNLFGPQESENGTHQAVYNFKNIHWDTINNHFTKDPQSKVNVFLTQQDAKHFAEKMRKASDKVWHPGGFAVIEGTMDSKYLLGHPSHVADSIRFYEIKRKEIKNLIQATVILPLSDALHKQIVHNYVKQDYLTYQNVFDKHANLGIKHQCARAIIEYLEPDSDSREENIVEEMVKTFESLCKKIRNKNDDQAIKLLKELHLKKFSPASLHDLIWKFKETFNPDKMDCKYAALMQMLIDNVDRVEIYAKPPAGPRPPSLFTKPVAVTSSVSDYKEAKPELVEKPETVVTLTK